MALRSSMVAPSRMSFASASDDMDGTFKTAVDIASSSSPRRTVVINDADDIYKLPPVVNFVALRETFLSEAPFVKRTNRMFWKKWIDSKQYGNALAVSLRFITGCISDNGAVNVGKLYAIDGNLLVERLSSNISEMLTLERDYLRHTSAHDVLFTKLPEVLAYMIINSLLGSLPKLARVYYSAQFRELLLDWLNEVIGGLRITNCRKDREWLFSDATEMNIVVLNQNRITANRTPSSPSNKASSPSHRSSVASIAPSLAPSMAPSPSMSPKATSRKVSIRVPGEPVVPDPSMPKMYNAVQAAQQEERYKRDNDMSRYSRATSCFVLENSPLVKMYLNGGRAIEDRFQCQHPLKISMSHVPDRPLISMQPETITKEGTFREKKMDRKHLNQVIRHSTTHREQILKELAAKDHELKRDLTRMKHAYQIQLDILNKKPVTQKQLLAAATAIETAKIVANAANDDNT